MKELHYTLSENITEPTRRVELNVNKMPATPQLAHRLNCSWLADSWFIEAFSFHLRSLCSTKFRGGYSVFDYKQYQIYMQAIPAIA
jgi:hypothetical protein